MAPFFDGNRSDQWLDDFVPEGSSNFRKIPLTSARDDWHSRAHRATGFAKWLQYWDQSRRAFPAAGVITVFPQPALMTAVQKSLRRLDVPLLAWCFNLGQYPRGLKRAAARMALKSVDRFVVHSTGEIGRVSAFLDIPPGRIEFVPLQRAPIPVHTAEETEQPFIVSVGSANRDYVTFFRAAEICGLRCKVVASPRSVQSLRIPAKVSVLSGLTAAECHEIVQRSRFSVIPLADPDVASGQVTLVESMRMTRPVIATDSIGTTDYIRDHWSGRLIPPRDPEALAAAMSELWDDASIRRRYARNAAEFAETSLSDEAAASALARIISELEIERRPGRVEP